MPPSAPLAPFQLKPRPGPQNAPYQTLAIGLVERLMDKDERLIALEMERVQLQARLNTAASHAPGGDQEFDIPRTQHPWPLADNPELDAQGMWLYDVRVDDAVLREGRRGEEFLAQFALLSETPDVSGAIAALNRLPPRPAGPPEVSIVIPVYGQLAYTLNALDSLLRHTSQARFEIIIIDDRSPDASGIFLPQLRGIRYHLQPQNGGFIASCNSGAGLAEGRVVVMLNNDVRVVEHWLDALLASFTHFPRAGLVGSKLFYPDGKLQEAGGIVWRDGSAWNYGHNDDPNRPHYSHARQVDYVSGCAIALPTPLWRQLGGFDPFFTPAYCEDVDLAFRVREAGLEVWMQPQSRIIHYEGRTSGTDLTTGAKAYQVVNTKKLYLRWRDRLSRHRANARAPYFERARDVTKRLLVVDSSTPTPDQDAGSVQTVLGLQVCAALGYKPYFVPQDNWLFQPRYTTALQAMGVECAYAPYELGFEAYMQRYGWMFDVVLVYRPKVMEACAPIIRALAPQAPLLFHVADLHHLRMQREAELTGNAEMAEAARLMKERELAVIAQADCTITHSTAEQEMLADIAPGAPVAVWPLMAEWQGTQAGFAARRDICFIGGYGHPPNIDAMLWFAAKIFPLLRAAEPGIRLFIAGAHPPEEILALAAPDIIVTGQIPDLRDLFDTVRVFVCPLRVGAGVKGKVATALAYGLPVVSTGIGVEGSGLTPEQDVLVADQPDAFTAAVLRVYRDEALWSALSQNGQDFVRRELSLTMGERMLRGAIDQALMHKLGIPPATADNGPSMKAET